MHISASVKLDFYTYPAKTAQPSLQVLTIDTDLQATSSEPFSNMVANYSKVSNAANACSNFISANVGIMLVLFHALTPFNASLRVAVA